MGDISLFSNVRDVTPCKVISVAGLLGFIRNGFWQFAINKVRCAATKEERKAAKEALPCVTVSGTFLKREQSELIKHSGFICIDFDKFPETTDLDTARALLCADPYTYAGFVSCSGNGFAVIVCMEPDASRQREVYEGLAAYYRREYGFETDPAPKNVASLRFVSYDPDLFLNEQSKIYEPNTISDVPKSVVQKQRETPVYDYPETDGNFYFVMEQVRLRGSYVADNYDDWVRMGYALASEFGNSGWRYFNEISSNYPKYNERDTRKKYDYCLKGNKSGCTIKTFFWLCKQAGIPLYPPKEPKTTNSRPTKEPKTTKSRPANGKKVEYVPPAPSDFADIPLSYDKSFTEIANEFLVDLTGGRLTSPELPPPEKPKNALMPNNEMFKVLGFVKSGNTFLYVFFDKKANRVIYHSASALKRNTIVEIAPAGFWREYYETDNGGVAVQSVVDWLILNAKTAGYIDTSVFRGRGVWFDDGRIVVHNGNNLIVNEETVALGNFQSEYVYEAGRSLGLSSEKPMHFKEAKEYLELTKYIAFKRNIDRYLYIGWCVIAPFCGALRYRPHLWVDGKSDMGKTWLSTEILRPMLGSTAVSVKGKTTAAGIVQRLKSDALNVVIDEAFGENPNDVERLQQIIELARNTFVDDASEVLKGNTQQTGVSFQVRGCFALSSIISLLENKSDLRRFAVVTLEKNTPDRFKSLQRMVFGEPEKGDNPAVIGLMKHERITRLHARTLRLLPIIMKNIETLTDAIAANVLSRGIGDMLAPMLAGAYSLKYSTEMSSEFARRWVSILKISSEVSNTDVSDEESLLDLILIEVITVYIGKEVKRKTIGELIQIAAGMASDEVVLMKDADNELQLLGIKYNDGYVCFKFNHPSIKKILEKTNCAKNYHQVLLRVPGAFKQKTYIKGLGTPRTVFVPYDAFGFDMLFDPKGKTTIKCHVCGADRKVQKQVEEEVVKDESLPF